MTKRIASGALAACLAGCGTYATPVQLLSGPPPAFETVKAELDAKGCQNSFWYWRGSNERSSETPSRKAGCFAHMPKIFIDARVQGRCASMYDVDDAGIPVNRETRCNVGSPRMALSEAWAEVAEASFRYAVDRQFSTWRYQAVDEKPAAPRRHSLYIQNFFGIEGESAAIPSPAPFQRPPPAPPLPPDLVERAAKIEAENAKLNPNPN